MNGVKGRSGRPRAACGTVNGHKGHKRRGEPSCDACAAAWSEAHPPRRPDPEAVERRKAAFRADPTDRRHGTTNGYKNLDCRCQPCRDAWAASMADYYVRHPEQVHAKKMNQRARRGVEVTPREMGLVPVGDVAQMLGITRYTVSRLGLVLALIVGCRHYYRPDEVMPFLVARARAQYGQAIVDLLAAEATSAAVES